MEEVASEEEAAETQADGVLAEEIAGVVAQAEAVAETQEAGAQALHLTQEEADGVAQLQHQLQAEVDGATQHLLHLPLLQEAGDHLQQ